MNLPYVILEITSVGAERYAPSVLKVSFGMAHHPLLSNRSICLQISCPQSPSGLEQALRDEIAQRGPLIVAPGSFLWLQDYGVIVNVDKTGWLRGESSISAVRGRELCRHNIENTPVPVPVEAISEIISQRSGLEAIG